MPSRGPAKDLQPRTCEVCTETFQPYRDWQRTCSRRCYGRLPERKASSAQFLRREDVKARKNAARRVAAGAHRQQKNLQYNLKRSYGLTLDEYAAMLSKQRGVCALCGEPPVEGGVRAASRLHVDHDHVSGKVRALLCNHCNRGIGGFRDDPELLRKAAKYVTRHRP